MPLWPMHSSSLLSCLATYVFFMFVFFRMVPVTGLFSFFCQSCCVCTVLAVHLIIHPGTFFYFRFDYLWTAIYYSSLSVALDISSCLDLFYSSPSVALDCCHVFLVCTARATVDLRPPFCKLKMVLTRGAAPLRFTCSSSDDVVHCLRLY